MKTAWFTICAKNYLAYALTLYHSLIRHHPDADFTLFLADDPDGLEGLGSLEGFGTSDSPYPFRIIPVCDLDLPTWRDMSLRYDVMEFATAIKPACFNYQFHHQKAEHAVYLDPDIFVVSPMEKIETAFDDGHELILTPHIQTPYEDNFFPNEQQILKAGIYNLGFAGMKNSSDIQKLLTWWQGKLLAEGHNAIDEGMFVDQKYMELGPNFVSKTHILNDKGYNAAYWNLHERPVNLLGEKWHAGSDPLAFFHFSGVVPEDKSIFSRHQTRFGIDDIADLRALLISYLAALNANNHSVHKKRPYHYNQFGTGETITPIMRKAYARSFAPENSPLVCTATKFSFDTDYFCKLDTEFSTLPTIIAQCWREKPDLQKAFPLSSKEGQQKFIGWFEQEGQKHFSLPKTLIEKALQEKNLEHAPAHQDMRNKASSLAAKGAATILNHAPALRPLYSQLPLGLRSFVKSALYRAQVPSSSYKKDGTPPNNLDTFTMAPATGAFNPARKPGIHVYGYLRSQSGIGQGARALTHGLKNLQIPLATTNISNLNDPRETFAFPEIASPKAGMRIALLNANAQQVMKFEELANPRKLDGTYKIAYWVWELSHFPDVWRPAIDRVDEIWVPSQFVADSLTAATDKPVHIIPHILTSEMPAALARKYFQLPEDRTIFLTGFDVNSFIRRKNPDATIKAFRKAFDANSPNAPVLAIKVHGNQGDLNTRELLNSYIEGAPNILIIDQTLKRDEYLALHYNSDVFVSLHRSEGFGLNLTEAMLIGKPVIGTDYSGNRDYLNHENGIPIPYHLVPVAKGAYPYDEGQVWAEADSDAAAAAMEQLAFDKSKRERLGKMAQHTITNQYSVETVTDLIKSRLLAIDPDLPLKN